MEEEHHRKQEQHSRNNRFRRPPAAPSWSAFPHSDHTSLGQSSRKQQERSGSGGIGSGKLPSAGTSPSSPGMASSAVRMRSCCCDSCRPSPRRANASKNSSNSRFIEYDDVFGGPPRSISSPSRVKMAVPDYEAIFRNRGKASPCKQSISRMELPVFDPPEYHDNEVFGGASPIVHRGAKTSSSFQAAEIVYDDVFGGPPSGPRTRFLRDLLKCSGDASSKKKHASKATSSDSSPLSSSLFSHGNPVYEFDPSDVFANGKNSSSSAAKSPQASVQMGSRPFTTTASVSSSPFTDHSATNTFSTRVSEQQVCDKMSRNNISLAAADAEITSSSSSGSFELDFQDAGSASTLARVRRTRKSDAVQAQAPPASSCNTKNDQSPAQSSAESPELRSLEMDALPKINVRPRAEEQARSVTLSALLHDDSLETEVKSNELKGSSIEQEQDEEDEAGNHSGALGTESFMEYSIKDLDGLVAEEYVVSRSRSDSSSSSVSVDTSPTYEAEGSESDCGDVSASRLFAKKLRKETVGKEGDRASRRPFQKHLQRKEQKTGKPAKATRLHSSEEASHEDTPKQDSRAGFPHKSSSAAADASSASETSSSPETSPPEAAEKTNSEGPLSSSSSGFSSVSPLGDFEDIQGESPAKRKLRLDRHQRALERVARVLEEKCKRDMEEERAREEKQRVADLLDDVIKRWAAGKQGNLRAFLSTLQYILWPECGWRPISLMDIIEPTSVRKAYKKATLCVHPDKLQQKGASIEHKYIAEKVFDYLQEAWNIFNYEQLF